MIPQGHNKRSRGCSPKYHVKCYKTRRVCYFEHLGDVTEMTTDFRTADVRLINREGDVQSNQGSVNCEEP